MSTQQPLHNPGASLSRLLRPRSLAVLGGSWAHNVVEQCQRMGFAGDVWPVHPRRKRVAGLRCFSSLADLPAAPDATFVGVNRFQTIEVVRELAAMGGGGAVCFASGFGEASGEDEKAAALHDQLLAAAAGMPIIGPNCYGLINFLDGALLWPDQHGGQRAEEGVAFVTQSSNIAINLTMQARALPIAYILTAGNQAQLSLGQLGAALLEDKRVTALAMHIEGFGDVPAFEQMALRAKVLGKPIVVIKVGRTEQAQQAMLSHTNSLSGSDSAADAFLTRLGIARLYSLPAMLETLKLLHVHGPLPGCEIQSMSCSGGEASLMSDAAMGRSIVFPPLSDRQQNALRSTLGPLVALANPLDYHTYIWDDQVAMTATFSAMLARPVDISLLILDFPRSDRCEYPGWLKALDALLAARDATGSRVGVVASLPENMPEWVAMKLIESNIVPFSGIDEALIAIQAAHFIGDSLQTTQVTPTLCLNPEQGESKILDESIAKQSLERYKVNLPLSISVDSIEELPTALERMPFPVVLKGRGMAHKTESGAVVLNLQSCEQVLAAARGMQADENGFLVEEYIDNTVVELLVSIVRDHSHGFQLTLAAGGVLAELLSDATHLLLPVQPQHIQSSLAKLKIAKLLSGYRNQPAAALDDIVRTVMCLQDYALDHAETLSELEINPLLCTLQKAVVADALIKLTGDTR